MPTPGSDTVPVDGREVAARFALGEVREPVREVDRGRLAVVWRLDTDRGAFAVKELRVPMTEDQARRAADLAASMRGRGVLAPAPVRARDGALLARCGPSQVRVETWVDLAPPTTNLAPEAVGALLATLHRDPIPAPGGVDPWYVQPVAPSRWADLADRLDAADAPFAGPLREQSRSFLDEATLFRAPGRTQLCHRDLWEDNLRRAGDLLCVIDWDSCGPAEAVQEVGVALVTFAARDPQAARRLASAYRAHGGAGVPTGPGDFTMALAQLAHFAETAAERWLAAEDPLERARAEAWFREGYDEPFGREQIAGVLDAVRGV